MPNDNKASFSVPLKRGFKARSAGNDPVGGMAPCSLTVLRPAE